MRAVDTPVLELYINMKKRLGRVYLMIETYKYKEKTVYSVGILLLVILISGICMLPCIKSGLPYGDDQSIHMLRVESLLKAFKSGQGYPVYIYQNMLENYGYGIGIFYPDLFLLPVVFFRMLGMPPEIAMKTYIYC